MFEVVRPPDSLFTRPSILSKWSGLRGLAHVRHHLGSPADLAPAALLGAVEDEGAELLDQTAHCVRGRPAALAGRPQGSRGSAINGQAEPAYSCPDFISNEASQSRKSEVMFSQILYRLQIWNSVYNASASFLARNLLFKSIESGASGSTRPADW